MLVISLGFSLLLLVLANLAVRRSSSPSVWLLLQIPAGVFGPICLNVFLPGVALQAVLVFCVYGIWRLARWPRGAFTALSVAAVVLAYVIPVWMIPGRNSDMARLREQFPFESMEARVPQGRPALQPANLPNSTATRLAEMEARVSQESGGSLRQYMLRELHENVVKEFIDSPGFGVGRQIRPNERTLTSGLRTDPVPRQPGIDDSPSWTPLFPGAQPELHPGDEERFTQMHSEGVLDFVNPRGFGLVKDRRHVAGFQPHQFSQVPKTSARWILESVDLVSLLLHEKPVVYVSANLPKMDELRRVPTRSLDEIEVAGLAALQKGEDQFVQTTAGGLRMLGSLRAVKQCVDCHGGERGDLLGAFSYTLRPAER